MKAVLNPLFSLLLMSLFIFGLSFYSNRITNAESQSLKPATVNVDIKLFGFKPEALEIPAGTTVVWTNFDAIEHSVTNGTPEKSGMAFDSDFFTVGETFTFTFEKPGTYPYFCKRHNSMQGKIKVLHTTP
jgi:plastocyanin